MSTSSSGRNLPNSVQRIGSSEARDHLVNIIKAGMNVIPGVGGVISSLIDDYIPKVKEERLRKLLDDLSKDAQVRWSPKFGQVAKSGFCSYNEYGIGGEHETEPKETQPVV